MRFSQYFNINKSQSELEFVDIPLDMDIRLFVDPYAISIVNEEWFYEANDIILDFFSLAVKNIKDGHDEKAKTMLRNLGESNETHFGFSKKSETGPKGRGVGPKQANLLYNGLKTSRAGKSGLINDFLDCELLIPDIGPDKISDVIIRIIKRKLIEFTQQQCELYKIPMKKVATENCWDHQNKRWVSEFAELPVYKSEPIILIPVRSARYYSVLDAKTYFDYSILDYLKAEHESAGSALVRTLADGTPRVYKEDLKNLIKRDNKNTKLFIQEFSEEHPEILASYKKSALQNAKSLTGYQIEEAHRKASDIQLNTLREKLLKIPSGKKHANEFHDIISKILTGLFSPQLRNPVKEERMDNGRKRIDLTFENHNYEQGFFSNLNRSHHIKCPYIIIECKNYSDDIANNEFDQLIGRFDKNIGFFGFIICRENNNAELVQKRCYDAINRKKGHVIVLDDNDIIELIRLKQLEISNNYNQVDNFLEQKMKKLNFQA